MADLYTRPSASAADAQFPAASYTRPANNAAHAQFPAPTATGFKPTTFGTAHVHPGWVPGWKAAKFGTVVGKQVWAAASLGNIAKFSWVQTVAVSGFKPVRLGTPVATATMPTVLGSITYALGFLAVGLGTPAAVRPQSGTASGLRAVTFGTPSAVRGGRATGFAPRVFGAPKAVLGQRATGLLATVTGTGRAVLTQQVLPRSAVSVRFGTPTSVQAGKLAAGFAPVRFGRPLGYSRFNYPAAGFKATRYGTPQAKQGHRVSSLGPVVRLGTPIVQRSALC